MSGRLGRAKFLGPLTVNRSFNEWSILRAISSGFVPRCRTRAISALRFLGDKISLPGTLDGRIFRRVEVGEAPNKCIVGGDSRDGRIGGFIDLHG